MDRLSDERGYTKERILDYCRQGGRDGGVMMICGPRGVGKTRLVDESLCLPSKTGLWGQVSDWVMGDHNGRLRLSVPRSPRFMERFLIKVEIDPYFPQIQEQSSWSEVSEEVSRRRHSQGRRKTDVYDLHDNNGRAFQMLRNVVVGLTNILDPHASRREHGRTLRDKLGWWNYWFAPNALWWPAGLDKGVVVAIWLLLIETVSWVLISLHDWAPGWLIFLAALAAASIPWPFLRWLDWRALGRITGHLYNLVHAQDFDLKEENRRINVQELKQRWSLVAGLLLILTVLGVEVGPDIYCKFDSLCPSRQEQAETKKTAGTPDTPSREHPPAGDENKVTAASGQSGVNSPPNPQSAESNIQLNPLDPSLAELFKILSFLMGAGLLVSSRTSREELHAVSNFGQQNPAWMVSLLRRYLYQLHRCGIEPVLVFDELDKLEEPFVLGDNGQQGQVSLSDFRSTDKLELFLHGMLRLRQSVGADFLTILIGGPRLYQVLHDHRWNKEGGAGVLGTLIQYDAYLGPVRPACLGVKAPEAGADTDCKELSDDPALAPLERRRKAWVWVESRGLFSNIRREMQDTTPLAAKLLAAAELIAERADALWEPDSIAKEIAVSSSIQVLEGTDTLQVLHDPWRMLWIRTGIAHMAWDMLRLTESPFDMNAFQTAFAEKVGMTASSKAAIGHRHFLVMARALASTDHRVLLDLGRFLLIMHMQWRYLAEPRAGGIPPMEQTDGKLQIVLPSIKN